MKARRLAKVVLTDVLPESIYLAINAMVATRDIVSRRRWEPEITMLSKFVSPGDTVIDIGGNHGLYAYHLSRLVGPWGRVHSFEPLPPNLRVLNHTVKTLGLRNVTVHPAACGEKAKSGQRLPSAFRWITGSPSLAAGTKARTE